jgi:hypothetical protein
VSRDVQEKELKYPTGALPGALLTTTVPDMVALDATARQTVSYLIYYELLSRGGGGR